MRLATVDDAGREVWGAVDGDELADLAAATGIGSLRDALEELPLDRLAAAAVGAPRLGLDGIRWLPPIPVPRQIFCAGINYQEHREETRRDPSAHPTIFLRLATSQNGHLSPIVRSPASDRYDYEGEIAVVVGRPGERIPEADALAHVAAIGPYNDVSVRDWQRHTSQWTPGKNFPTTGCFGPWIATLDEVGDLDACRLTTRVNGATLQEATAAQMIFSVPELIAYISTFAPLLPGDVIVTGTPGGVGFLREPPILLQPGDEVEVEVSGVGVLRNPVRDA